MHLFLCPIAKALVCDDIISTIVLHEALWSTLVEPSGLLQVVSFDILRMEIVLHDITVPVAILPLGRHCLQVADHPWVVDLIGDGVVELRVSAFVARRNLIFCAEIYFNLTGVVSMLGIFCFLGIIKLLCDRVELSGLQVLVATL